MGKKSKLDIAIESAERMLEYARGQGWADDNGFNADCRQVLYYLKIRKAKKDARAQ